MLTLQSELRPLTVRTGLGQFLNSRGLTGKAVEVGTLYGNYAKEILATWKGERLYCMDPWQNQDEKVYFDGANKADMEHIFRSASLAIGTNTRCTMMRCLSLTGVGCFKDGELDAVYLDGNHAVGAVRDDIQAWWPKVKIGGVLGGHDFFTRYDHETNSDALTAVMELADALGVMPHVTWCTSWWFLKTKELDEKFRAACLAGRFEKPTYSYNDEIDVVTVMPVARFDWNLAKKNVAWMRAAGCKEKIVAFCSPDLNDSQKTALEAHVEVVVADSVKETGYFGTPNQMIRGALEYVEKHHPKKAMLWCEADAIPLRGSWIREISEEYRKCGRPFMGDVYRGQGAVPHMTGNAVYHPNWRRYAPSLAALTNEPCGWDTLCAHETLPRAHEAKTIQQVWRPRLPITREFVKATIRPECVLFHQVKDGSLIDILCADAGLPVIPLDAPLCKSTYETQKANLGPYHSPIMGAIPPAQLKRFAHQLPQLQPAVTLPQTHILIVTFKRDMDFLRYCLKSIEKHASGFSGVTIAVPSSERGLYNWVKHASVVYFDETPGKGMLHHEIMVCRADELCPNAGAILHVDADCMFWSKVTPADYLPGGKPLLVRERYASLRNTNRLIWQKCVENAIGVRPEYECMVRHPQIHLREVYAKTRELVAQHNEMPFDQYVLSCNNAFPQGFAEFPLLGAVAIAHFRERYECVDYDWRVDAHECGLKEDASFQYAYRRDRDKLVETWSHAGIGRYKSDLEGWLNGRIPAYFLK